MPKLSEYYGHLPLHDFFSLSSISSSLQRLFHINCPTGCPRSSGPCPRTPLPGNGLTQTPAAHGESGAAKGLHNLPSLKACSLPSIASPHAIPQRKIKVTTPRHIAQFSYEPQTPCTAFPVTLCISKIIITEVFYLPTSLLSKFYFVSLLFG